MVLDLRQRLLVRLVLARVGRVDLRQANLLRPARRSISCGNPRDPPPYVRSARRDRAGPAGTCGCSDWRDDSRCAAALRCGRRAVLGRQDGCRRARTSNRCCRAHTHPIAVHEIDGTSQPKAHISTARIWVSTIATNSGAAGKGGMKNQRSVRVMNSSRWPPATNCRNITVCSWLWSRVRSTPAGGSDSTLMPIKSRPNDSTTEKSPSTRRDAEQPRHLPADRLLAHRRVVIGDGHDRDVVKQRHDDDHDRGERLETEKDGRQHDQEHDVHRQGDAIDRVAGDAAEDPPRFVDGVVDHREAGSGQDQRRGAARGIGRAGDRRAAVGLLQRRRVVDAVAGHRHQMAAPLQRLDDGVLVLGKDPREAVRRLDRIGDRGGTLLGSMSFGKHRRPG